MIEVTALCSSMRCVAQAVAPVWRRANRTPPACLVPLSSDCYNWQSADDHRRRCQTHPPAKISDTPSRRKVRHLAHPLPKESRVPGTVFSRHTFCHDGGAFFLAQQGRAPQHPLKNFSDFQTLMCYPLHEYLRETTDEKATPCECVPNR